MDLKDTIRTVPDFPQKGILFRDITTLLKDKDAYRQLIDSMAVSMEGMRIDAVVGLEARGFVIGAPLAYRMGVGFIPIRKKGKLPGETYAYSYQLEYGEDTFEMHKDALAPGTRVAIIDDLLATGGTALAACKLVETAGAQVAALRFAIELEDLGGAARLQGYDIGTEIVY